MNNGAFGENFPYSNFHDLNMDWIIKIAKDFLDQYTHIQEIIANGEQSLQDLTTSGLEQLQEKADALEALLQQWYETHSEDIANQLADALEDLNEWYTQHQGYLDQYVTTSISDFQTRATQIGNAVIASIPADYTALSESVENAVNTQRQADYLVHKILNINLFPSSGYTDGYYKNYNNGTDSTAPNYFYTPLIPVAEGGNYYLQNTLDTLPTNAHICFYDETETYIEGVIQETANAITIPSGICYMIISLPIANRAGLGLYAGSPFESTAMGTSYYIDLVKNNMVKCESLNVLPTNYSVTLPDLNNAKKNTCYIITLSAFSVDNLPANLPYDIYIEPGLLMNYETTTGYKLQIFYLKTGIFTRFCVPTNNWQPWTVVSKPTIDIPNGIALIRVVESGIPCNINLSVDVELYTAYKQTHGDDYWDNYQGYSVTGNRNDSGLYLHPHVNFNGNGRSITFTPTTVTTPIQRDFSPFNLGGDNTLKNVIINIGSGAGNGVCRYAIHDDFAITNEGILIENVEMRGTGHSGALLGSGVKPYCTYIIRNCICRENQGDIDISYHANSSGTNAPSKLVIEGCYCEKDIVVVHVQDNQIKTPCLVSNNRCRSVYARYGTYAPYANMELIEWNNVTN